MQIYCVDLAPDWLFVSWSTARIGPDIAPDSTPPCPAAAESARYAAGPTHYNLLGSYTEIRYFDRESP